MNDNQKFSNQYSNYTRHIWISNQKIKIQNKRTGNSSLIMRRAWSLIPEGSERTAHQISYASG